MGFDDEKHTAICSERGFDPAFCNLLIKLLALNFLTPIFCIPVIMAAAAAAMSSSGTTGKPYKTISARSGKKVIVAPGIYREYVNPVSAGTQDARITYRSGAPGQAAIAGADSVKGCKRHNGDVWVCKIGNGWFGSYTPYTTVVEGDCTVIYANFGCEKNAFVHTEHTVTLSLTREDGQPRLETDLYAYLQT